MDTQDPNRNLGATQLMGADPDATCLAGPDPDATRLAGPDPDATRLAPADPDATRLADAGATQLVDAPRTTKLPPRAVPTTVLGRDDAAPAADGFDALDDPLATPIDLDDLTTVRTPVELRSPVKSTKKKGLPVWGVILIVVLVLGALGAAGWYTYQLELWGGRTVPAVVGLDQASATTQLETSGFKVAVQQAYADDAIGTVLSCSPAPGSRAETSGGATITVAAARTIPQLTGTQMDAAEKALLELGAKNIRIQSVSSDDASGTVVSVSPAEGARFKSTDEIVLSVATPYVVPTVSGLTLDAAKSAVEKAGLTAEVKYVTSDKAKNTVVGSEPAAGTQAKEGDKVTLSVSTPYPAHVYSLAGYLDATSQEISAYMTQEKYSIVYGSAFSNGDAHVVYMGTDGDTVAFTTYPESRTAEGNARDDVLAKGAPISGVCYTFPTSNASVSSAAQTADGVRSVMETCGFGGYKNSCTADDLEKLGFKADGRSFVCGYGETSDYYWAVVIGGSANEREVSAMIFLKSHFDSIDLGAYDNRIDKYIAYVYLYDDSSVLKKEYPSTTTEQKEGESGDQQSADQSKQQ